MNARSKAAKAAKADWQARKATYAAELTDQINDEAAARMAGWAARGRIPLWVRVKAAAHGRRTDLPPGDAPQ